jgi:hypothetical protein
MGERGEIRILSIHPCGTSRVLLDAVKSYDLSALLPIREESVLQIFIAIVTFYGM